MEECPSSPLWRVVDVSINDGVIDCSSAPLNISVEMLRKDLIGEGFNPIYQEHF
jgi:hypothetical protein